MIGGLQGEFGDLDIKYLKQNISKYPKMSVANIRKLQENTAALVQNGCSPIRVGAISGSEYVYPEKFETPSSPIRRHAPDAKYPNGMCWMQDIRVESGGSRMEWRRSRV